MKQQPSAWGRPHAPALPRWGRKTLSLFLSVVLCLSMLPATVLADETGQTHTHDVGGTSVAFTPWNETSSLPSTKGNYYLMKNVTLDTTWTPVNGTVLCLNGHSIRANGSFDTIKVNSGVTFTLTDCATTPGKITHTSGATGRGVYVDGGTFHMYGGNISGNTGGDNGGGMYIRDGGNFTMSGGSITGNNATNGGAVYVDGNLNGENRSQFNMNGGTIGGTGENDANTAEKGGGVYMTSGSRFNMSNGKIIGNKGNKTSNGNGGGVYMDGGNFQMSGGAIGGTGEGNANTAKNGGGVYMNYGFFTMSDNATITGNNATSYGGGVHMHYGEFTLTGSASITGNTANGGGGVYMDGRKFDMNGGIITGNTAYGNGSCGGGVYMYGGIFDMTGGRITDNKVDGNGSAGGGGVRIYNARFTMSDGSITGNSANSSGGGVCLAYSSSFTMTGGNITGNNSSNGGGVAVYGGSFTMTGGNINGNNAAQYGGGVFVSNTFTVSSAVNITDNFVGGTKGENGNFVQGQKGTKSNVHLDENKTITIRDGLTDTARIGVTTENTPTSEVPITITTGASENVDYTKIFTPDVTGQNYLVIRDGNALKLSVHHHSWNYTLSANEKTITATCERCPLVAGESANYNGGSVTISAPSVSEGQTLTYDGTPKEATVDNASGNWQGGDVTITYQVKGNGENDWEPLTGDNKPSDAGTYRASITRGEGDGAVTAKVEYTIAKATPTVSGRGTASGIYGQKLSEVTVNGLTAMLNGQPVAGNWAWKDGQGETLNEVTGSGSTAEYTAVFTPNDTANITNAEAKVAVTIAPKAGGSLGKKAFTQKFTDTAEKTFEPDWAGLPTGESWTFGGDSSKSNNNISISTNDLTVDGKKLTYAISGGSVNDMVTFTLKATCASGHYEPFTITLTVTLVDRDPQTFTFNEAPVNKTYGDDDFTFAATGAKTSVSYSSSDETVATVDDSGKVHILKAGTATITATAAQSDEYSKAEKSYTLTVGKKPLTITAEDKTAYRGAAIPELTYTVSGLVGEEKLTKAPTLTTNADMNIVGEYKITASGAENSNYAIDYVDGKLTVLRRSSSSSSSPTYSVTTPAKTENGSVTISPKNAKQGSTVTITVTPDAGYVLGDLGVTDKNGKTLPLTKKSDTQYTFTMPTGGATVKASFGKDSAGQTGFVDVKDGDYFYDAVRWAVEKGVTNGTDATHFSPDANCTRAQIVTFLWRAAGSPEPRGVSGFVDVAEDSYYAKAVAWAVEQGITNGTDTTHFSPDASCTRAQSVTFLYRALGQKPGGQAAFADVPAESYYADAVAWAAEQGITNGTDATHFSPNAVCTRAQIVTFLYRAYQGK